VSLVSGTTASPAPSRTVTAADTQFFTRLESLRGIAALMVVAYHASYLPGLPGAISHDGGWVSAIDGAVFRTLHLLFNGIGAVYLFFVLSGFVLACSIARGPADRVALSSRFLAARVFRLFPAIWAAVIGLGIVYAVFGSGVMFYPGPITADRLVGNMLLFSADMNTVMWSLQLEMIAAPLVLSLGLLDRRVGPWPIVAAMIVLGALSFTSRWTFGLGGLTLNPLAGFAVGMLIRHLGDPVAAAGRVTAGLCLAAAVVLFFTAEPLMNSSHNPLISLRWPMIAETLAAAAIIALIAFRPQLWIGRVLDRPIWRFYGRISYSIYLLQVFALMIGGTWSGAIRAAIASNIPVSLVMAGAVTAVIAVLTPIAWASWRMIEVPGIALGRVLTARYAFRQQPARQ
jgi:peptidoglycan/LPS O-acetylase OafA/YrhL